MRTTKFLVATAACLATSSASAGPMEDFRAGKELHLRSMKVVAHGKTFFADGYGGTKAPGTLDLVIDGTALELGTSEKVHLKATQLDEGRIRYDFDKSFSPAIAMGAGATVSRVRGNLVVKIGGMHGSAATKCIKEHCSYSVTLESESTAVTVTGQVSADVAVKFFGFTIGTVSVSHPFDEALSDLTFAGWSGLPRPPLAYAEITVPSGGPCPFLATRTYWGEARLASPAPAHGAQVNVDGGSPGNSARTFYVPPGASSVLFPLRFGPTEGGLYAARISSGGVEVVRDFAVKACATNVDVAGYRLAKPRMEMLCRTCLDDARLTDRFYLVRHAGSWLDLRPEGPVSLDERVGGTVLDVRGDAFGHLHGSAWLSDSARSFRIDGHTGELTVGPELWPIGVADGAMFGVSWSQQNQSSPFAVVRDGQALPLALPPYTSQVVGLTPSHHVLAVGWDENTGGTASWRVHTDGTRSSIGSMGGETVATGLSSAGDIVGWASGPSEGRVAFVLRAGSQSLEVLPLPGMGQNVGASSPLQLGIAEAQQWQALGSQRGNQLDNEQTVGQLVLLDDPQGGFFGPNQASPLGVSFATELPDGQGPHDQQVAIADSAAVGIADDGLVLARYMTPTGDPRPFVTRVGSPGSRNLSELVDDLEGYALGEPIAIAPSGRIAVHATRDGEATILFLEPR